MIETEKSLMALYIHIIIVTLLAFKILENSHIMPPCIVK